MALAMFYSVARKIIIFIFLLLYIQPFLYDHACNLLTSNLVLATFFFLFFMISTPNSLNFQNNSLIVFLLYFIHFLFIIICFILNL